MTFRELLKKYDIKQLDIALALKIDPRNIRRFDDLKERTINEVVLIHELTKIPYTELIGMELRD
ncbi:hypothetical protein [Parabacteroides distasonis]|uniref:hypothetical protein n=1 Tax=Parabacteroides distasonis TaxID=823 RepID=UPI00321AD6E0